MTTSFDLYRGNSEDVPKTPVTLPTQSLLQKQKGRYLAETGLVEAVNIALNLCQPLLVTGEPGCGKTQLAWSIADDLGLGEPLVFSTRSTSKAQDLLYSYDAVGRFHDIQSRVERASQAAPYIRYEALGRAILEGRPRVVLVDEIDKAPRDFPNDLLWQLDKMEFDVPELPEGERRKVAQVRPIVLITSNSERQLPAPFLRRCVFHHIEFPSTEQLERIVRERLGSDGPDARLISVAVERFERVRQLQGLRKKPATGELLSWIVALTRREVTPAELARTALRETPLWQALIKDREDLVLLRSAS